MCSPAAMCSSNRRPARERPSHSASRWSSASTPTGRAPAALVLAPTRELATQIVEELREVAHARALRISAVYGGVGLHKQAVDAARPHRRRNPGRLEDLLQRGAFSLAQIRMLVLDEADRMLDMGFRPARRPHRCPLSAGAPDTLLLRNARRRGRQGRVGLHDRRGRALPAGRRPPLAERGRAPLRRGRRR